MAQGETRRRVLLKISGEALGGEAGTGISAGDLQRIAGEIVEAAAQGVQVGLVVGGGNFMRGAQLAASGIDRSLSDQIGMLATVMNGLALVSAIRTGGREARLLSAFPVGGFAEHFAADLCGQHLERGRVVVLVGGTGNPYFTTDTCASLRALEIGADILLKGTKVDGVYTGDPQVDPQAELFDRITYEQVLSQELRVMDATAVALCRENNLPIRVFNMNREGNIRRGLLMEDIGTLVAPS